MSIKGYKQVNNKIVFESFKTGFGYNEKKTERGTEKRETSKATIAMST